MQNCPFCKVNIDENSKFCSNCGKLLKKTCLKCDLKFNCDSNFCNQCGSRLNYQNSSGFDNPITSSNITGIENKAKVGILHGTNLESIKQELGGGTRRLYLHDLDSYRVILSKITDIYFPRNDSTCLGNVNNFRITLLDFKKQLLTDSNFTTFIDYIRKTGLTLNIKPIFYLHLSKKNYSNLTQTKTTTPSAVVNHEQINRRLNYKRTSESNSVQLVPNSASNLKSSPSGSSSSSSSTSSSPVNVSTTKQTNAYTSLRNLSNQISSKLDTSKVTTNKTRKRDRSSSSSSCSSSSSTCSWKEAKKLDKKLNCRINELKESSSSTDLKKPNNPPVKKVPLLPLPTPTTTSYVQKEIKKEKDDEVVIISEKNKEISSNFRNHQNNYNNNYNRGYSSHYNSYQRNNNTSQDNYSNRSYNWYNSNYTFRFKNYNSYHSSNKNNYEKNYESNQKR